MSETTDAASAFSKSRLEALTDGVFAVAMTLLVIELRVPEQASVGVPRDLIVSVVNLLPKFVSWIISFFVLGIFWFTHHRLFHHCRAVDGPLLWLNILYLSFVSLMPFSSALVGEYPRLAFAQIFYSSNMMVLSGVGLLKNRYVFRHPELWAATLTLGFYRAARFRKLGLIVVALAAIGVTTIVPGAGNLAFMLMIPISILSRRIEERSPATR